MPFTCRRNESGMTALVANHINLTKSSSKGWKQCTCCPYGYHIDLDFVRYCENVANSQLLPRAVGIARQPRKRASMDILLGLPVAPTHSPSPAFRVEVCVQEKKRENDRSSPTLDGLQQAVEDFELTLRRASKTGHGDILNLDYESEMKGDWIQSMRNTVPWSRRKLRRIAPWHDKDSPEKDASDSCDVTDSQTTTNNSSISQGTLQTIRQQVASSLAEIKRLEDEVKQVPILQEEITRLKTEITYLTNKLNLAETNLKDGATKIRAGDSEKLLPKKRNIAVGTSIITRDVGVSHKLPLTANSGSMTDHYEPPTYLTPKEKVVEKLPAVSSQTQTDKYYEISLRHRLSQTELKMDSVYSSSDLERNIDKAIKLYEKTFHHLLHPRKPLLINSGVQVDAKSSICRDYGVQVRQETANFSAMVKPPCRNSGMQTFTEIIRKRDVGVSDDTISNSSTTCSIRKYSVGTNTNFDKELKLMSLMGRSKSFDQSNRKSLKSIAVGPDKSMCSSKSTDTIELNTKKDIAVNTTKNKLVDTAVDPISRPPTTLKRRGSGSKIPRPVTLPIRSRSFNRQDTYLVSPSPSRKSFGREGFDYDSGSEEGGFSTFNIDTSSSRQQSSESLFHPISVSDSKYVKKEISKEVRAALKVLNDGLVNINEGNQSYHLRSAITIVQQEWFKISSTVNTDPLEVEDILDCFEEFSPELLKYIVNMVDNTGNTAIHYTVSHGKFDVVSVLLDTKVCDVDKRNAAGFTCIMLVSLAEVKSLSHRQVVRRLFQLADVNIRAKQHGQTALMLAVSHERMDMVELLLDCGADINIQDDDGSTALMCAAENGQIDITKCLLAQPECDLTITDCDGNTALNIAMEVGNRDIGVLLYAQQHFSRGGSPYSSFKSKKPSSSTPTRTPSALTPTSSLPNKF